MQGDSHHRRWMRSRSYFCQRPCTPRCEHQGREEATPGWAENHPYGAASLDDGPCFGGLPVARVIWGEKRAAWSGGV